MGMGPLTTADTMVGATSGLFPTIQVPYTLGLSESLTHRRLPSGHAAPGDDLGNTSNVFTSTETEQSSGVNPTSPYLMWQLSTNPGSTPQEQRPSTPRSEGLHLGGPLWSSAAVPQNNDNGMEDPGDFAMEINDDLGTSPGSDIEESDISALLGPRP